MIKNEIYNSLNEGQLGILEEVLEGNNIEEANAKEVLSNLQMREYENETYYDEDTEQFEEIYRYLNSQMEDEDNRKEKLIKFITDEYRNIQNYIDEYVKQSKRDILPEEILGYGISMEDSMWKHAGILFGFSNKEACKIIKCKNLDFHGFDDDVNILDLVKNDNKKIESRSNLNKAYDLLNQLYNAVPEKYRDKISYQDDNGVETIYFGNEELEIVDNINYIGCLDGRICGLEDDETTEFDKHINIDGNGTYRNIFFRYKGNGQYKCEMTPKLEKGNIYKKGIKMITV